MAIESLLKMLQQLFERPFRGVAPVRTWGLHELAVPVPIFPEKQ